VGPADAPDYLISTKIMNSIILLNYNENTRQVEEEEKTRFLKDLLDQMGVPTDEFWTIGNSLSIDQRIKLRSALKIYGVQVIDDLDGFLQVYIENEKVAEWYKPTYKLKRDLQQLDRKKQLYIEMKISYWTVFEEQQ
jgi:hypothetical protein